MCPLELLFESNRLALWEQPGPGPRADAFLLVHGLGQHRSTFTAGAMPAELARHGRVILAELDGPDRASRARSPKGLAGYLFDVVPEAIARVRELPGVERVHYVGHSMGAYLGSALLHGNPPIRSLASFAAPWPLAFGRPQIKLAGMLARRALTPFAHQRFPVDVLLRLAKDVATVPRRRGLELFDLVRLGVPEEAPRDVLRSLFAAGVPESVSVMIDFAELAGGGDRIAGIDVFRAVERWPGPIFSALGDADVFGSAACLRSRTAAGPRRNVLVRDSGHSDLVIGRRARSLARELTSFLSQSGALERRDATDRRA